MVFFLLCIWFLCFFFLVEKKSSMNLLCKVFFNYFFYGVVVRNYLAFSIVLGVCVRVCVLFYTLHIHIVSI